MNKVNRLETYRCLLREIQMTDYEDIKKLYMDEKVRRYLGGTVNEDRYEKSFWTMMKADAGDSSKILGQNSEYLLYKLIKYKSSKLCYHNCWIG